MRKKTFKCEMCHRYKATRQYFDPEGNELYICEKCWNKVPHPKPKPPEKEEPAEEYDERDDDSYTRHAFDRLREFKSKEIEKSSLNMDINKFIDKISKRQNKKIVLAAHYAAILMAKRNKLGKCRAMGVSMRNDKGKEMHSVAMFDTSTNSIYWNSSMQYEGVKESWWEFRVSLYPDGSNLVGTVTYYGGKKDFGAWTIEDVPLDFYDMVELVSGFMVKHGESISGGSDEDDEDDGPF